MLSVAHLDVLLEVLDAPIWFVVFWPPTSVNRHLPHPVKFMQRLLGEVFHSVHIFCSDPLAFTPVVHVEARERGDEGKENEPIARREFRPLLKKRRWKSCVLEDSLNSSKSRFRCQRRLWIRLGHGRKNPRGVGVCRKSTIGYICYISALFYNPVKCRRRSEIPIYC
jgi:hypothetical protein